MLKYPFLFLTSLLVIHCDPDVLRATIPNSEEDTFCVAFSPYVENYNPDIGFHPPVSLVAELLDKLVDSGRISCIYTYGTTPPLDSIPQLALERNLSVIQSIYLDLDEAVNQEQILRGIELAKAYPDTILALNCGSEVRLAHGTETANPIIMGCIDQVRKAEISQPISHSATWIEWCDFQYPTCQEWQPVAEAVDLILATTFAWWENIEVPDRFPGCISAWEAGEFHVNRLRDVQQRYPEKPIILSEFGWPSAPDGFVSSRGDASCAVAGPEEQRRVVGDTLRELNAYNLSGIAFSAFVEPWKESLAPFSPYWGLCDYQPFECRFPCLT